LLDYIQVYLASDILGTELNDIDQAELALGSDIAHPSQMDIIRIYGDFATQHLAEQLKDIH